MAGLKRQAEEASESDSDGEPVRKRRRKRRRSARASSGSSGSSSHEERSHLRSSGSSSHEERSGHLPEEPGLHTEVKLEHDGNLALDGVSGEEWLNVAYSRDEIMEELVEDL